MRKVRSTDMRTVDDLTKAILERRDNGFVNAIVLLGGPNGVALGRSVHAGVSECGRSVPRGSVGSSSADRAPDLFGREPNEDAMIEMPSIEQLSRVINQSIAPAFMLGAISGFIAVLVTRLNRIVDRCREAAGADENASTSATRADVGRLNARADLINRSLFWSVAAALMTIVMMIAAFLFAFLAIRHEWGIALLFVATLALFGLSLVNFAREIRLVIADPNNFD